MLWGGQDERRHQLAHQLRLDAYALVANYNVHHLRQIGAVHLWRQAKSENPTSFSYACDLVSESARQSAHVLEQSPRPTQESQ